MNLDLLSFLDESPAQTSNSKSIVKSRLCEMSSDKILSGFKGLVQCERKITAEILEYIKEIDRRRLYLSSHTSLFSFLTLEMGYSPSAAQRRIDAARLTSQIPEMKEDLKSGALHLSHLSLLARAVRQKEKEIPEKKVQVEEKKEILSQLKGKDLVQAEKILAQKLDLKLETQEIKRFQKDESVRLQITLSKGQMAELERVKQIISHQNPNPSMSELVSFLAKAFLKQKDPLINRKTSKSKAATVQGTKSKNELPLEEESKSIQSELKNFPTSQESKSPQTESDQLKEQIISENRSTGPMRAESNVLAVVRARRETIKAESRRTIFQKYRCCQWRSETGVICGSQFQLQVDHKVPVWANGSSEVDNLQLLCSVHNRLKYERESGIRRT